MRLDNFEEQINGNILKRGIAYWKNKAVQELEQEEKKVEAWVIGTEDYRVELEIDKEEVAWHSCTCPYDGGPICKHIVAVLFELARIEVEEEVVEYHASRNRGRPKTFSKRTVIKKKITPVKKKSKKPQFKSLIQELNESELREFIIELASSDRKLKDRFMAFFAHKWSEGNKEDYKVIFRNIMRSHLGRDGFLDYYNSGKFAREIVGMMGEIPEWIGTSPKNALALCQAIIEESHKVYEEGGIDDSSGDFGGLSSYALDYLKQLSEKADATLQEEIFTYCTSESEEKIYSDYGDTWHDFMSIVVPLTNTKKRMDILFLSLDRKQEKGSNYESTRNYYSEKIAKIKHGILSKLDPEKAAILMAEHIKLPSFRKAAIEKAFGEKNFGYAKELAEDGLVYNKDKAGLVSDWKEWLYKIAIEAKDEAAALELAEYFFGKGHRNMEDFHRLKKHYPKDKWNTKVNQILTAFTEGKNSWYNYGITHKICEEEERWEVLKKCLFNVRDFSPLKEYGSYIVFHFDKETLRDMYAFVVADKLKHTTGRSTYQEACKGIRQMKPLSDKEFIQHFIQSFKDKYPKRKAMIEELNNV